MERIGNRALAFHSTSVTSKVGGSLYRTVFFFFFFFLYVFFFFLATQIPFIKKRETVAFFHISSTVTTSSLMPVTYQNKA